MKLSKNMRYLVRIRDFETVHVEVGAEISDTDLNERPSDLDKTLNHMHLILDHEVDRLARSELEKVGEWSEINPNLAEDYLSTEPAYMQRNQHANQKTDPPAKGGRRIRRGADGGKPTPPTPPRRPAA